MSAAAAPSSGGGRVGDAPTPERAGDLAIVLHSHMPYVEGYGTYPFGEEWLFDAVLRSYMPILEHACNLTMSVTPVLADQLEDEGTRERLRTFGELYRVGSCELDAEQVDPPLRASVEAERERYVSALASLTEIDDRPLEAFRRAQEESGVELIASAATHAVLPLVATTGARRLQIDAGLRSHTRRFGSSPGFWLPECAYEPGLERLLGERGVTHFCVDQSAHEPAEAALRPIDAGAGTVAFPIDWDAVSWLWSLDGYPSDPGYSDFHRKTFRGARPWSIAGDAHDPERAYARARGHAKEFLDSATQRLRAHRDRTGSQGLLVFAIDTELLGHWWWEGPEWLAEVVKLAGADDSEIELVRLSQARERHEPQARELQRSSWGEHKDLSTWDSPDVADLARGARRLELQLVRALGSGRVKGPAAERAARELLAVQASDWAFLDKRRQAGDYPYQRVTDHSREFYEAIDSSNSLNPPDPRLRNLAPDMILAPLLEP